MNLSHTLKTYKLTTFLGHTVHSPLPLDMPFCPLLEHLTSASRSVLSILILRYPFNQQITSKYKLQGPTKIQKKTPTMRMAAAPETPKLQLYQTCQTQRVNRELQVPAAQLQISSQALLKIPKRGRAQRSGQYLPTATTMYDGTLSRGTPGASRTST